MFPMISPGHMVAGIGAVRRGGGTGRPAGSYGVEAFTIPWPVGTAAGDKCIVFVPFQGVNSSEEFANVASMIGGLGGWTKVADMWPGYGYWSAVFEKTLAPADIAAAVSVRTPRSGWPVAWAVYRGASVATIKSKVLTGSGSSLVLPGFAKASACKGLVSFATDRDEVNAAAPPAMFDRFAYDAGPGAFPTYGADLLSPKQYADGAAVVWTGFSAVYDQVGYLIELS